MVEIKTGRRLNQGRVLHLGFWQHDVAFTVRIQSEYEKWISRAISSSPSILPLPYPDRASGFAGAASNCHPLGRVSSGQLEDVRASGSELTPLIPVAGCGPGLRGEFGRQ
jgi:hypothetical protein